MRLYPPRASPAQSLLEAAEGPSPPEMLLLSSSSKLRLLEGTLRRSLPETLLVASDDSDFYTNTCAVHYRDLGACRALLGSAINWDQAFRIHGLRDGLYEASRDIAQTKGSQQEVIHYFIYFHPDPSSLPEIQFMSYIKNVKFLHYVRFIKHKRNECYTI
ncbi:glycine N-acyltransferase-like protein 3 [Pelodiscus sinensis]|uniref:glycine N-acyltransferase-like protein 3 n=1 Tax=Pelodiscus sinensis TaxID=13735 RepID=UPI003F6C0021